MSIACFSACSALQCVNNEKEREKNWSIFRWDQNIVICFSCYCFLSLFHCRWLFFCWQIISCLFFSNNHGPSHASSRNWYSYLNEQMNGDEVNQDIGWRWRLDDDGKLIEWQKQCGYCSNEQTERERERNTRHQLESARVFVYFVVAEYLHGFK